MRSVPERREDSNMAPGRMPRFAKKYLGLGVDAPQMVDAGQDAPLSSRGRWIWALVLAVTIAILAVLVAISR
jgi:hypothetical protein